MILSKIPTRITVLLMLFTAILVNFTMRANLSVNIVEMVPVAVESGNETNINGEEMKTLGWSVYERALVLSAYSWGYTVANIIGGPVAEHFGSRLVGLITTMACAVLTIASPVAAKTSYGAMVVLRICLGFFGGFIPPATQMLTATWAVTEEKGMFSAAFIVGNMGAVISWSLCGIIIKAFGWEWAFYAFGIKAIAWCILWWFFIYDTPDKHPRISQKERQFIKDGTPGISNKNVCTELKTPYFHMLTSIPVWAGLIGSLGTGCGMAFSLCYSPIFIAQVLRYDLTSTGFLSSLAYILRSISGLTFGLLGDFLLSRKFMSLQMLRKSFTVISHLAPGCFFIVLTFTNNALMAVILITAAIGLNGAVSVSSISYASDIAPNFAGTVFGIANGFCASVSIIIPLIVAYFTKDDETNFKAWQPLFYITGFVFIISGLLYMIFGSMKIQTWNYIENDACKNGTHNELNK